MAAAGGGDDPRRPPGPAHEYGPYKKLLWGIFEDMDNTEYKSFKYHLDCVVSSDNVSIPKYRIQRAKRQDMPDLILRYIQRREALDVVAGILEDLPNVQLLERIRQFTHPEPRSAGYIVMRVKHTAATQEEYLMKCHRIAEVLEECDPGLGDLILEEIRRQECVLVKYLLYIKELSLERPTDVLQKMSSEQRKEEFHHLGVIYITVDDATLFTGELHGDPRTWDPVEVTQWVARTLLPRDQTATIPDLQMTGAEICTRPERWFTSVFPEGQGRVLYSDLQQRRDDTACQRRFGGREEEPQRVVEKTSATFLVSAYLMSMMWTVLGQHKEKAVAILEYLQSLIRATKRRSKNKELLHSIKFSDGWASHNMIEERKESSSSAASVVYGATTIAISSEDYSQVVTSAAEAMEVIGAPLEISIKLPFLRRVFTAASKAFGTVGGALTTGVVAIIIAAARLFGVHQHLVAAFDVLDKSDKNSSVFKINYSQALILLPEVLQESEMTERKLQQIIERGNYESSIQDVERNMMKLLPYISKLSPRIPPSRIQEEAQFDYKAKMWLTDDSIRNINDTMTIAYLQFELRNQLRDVFVLGVIGSVKSGKNTMVKSVFPKGERRAHQTRACPYDVMLYDGSNDLGEGTLPVLLFPSGEGKVVDATHGLCTGVCGAFICVVEYVAGKESPDIGALARAADLHVPVLLCVNKCGGVKDQREASQIVDRYEYQVSRDFGSLRNLTEVVLTDFQTADRPAWLTEAEGVKYWIRDAIQNHKRYASNVEAEFERSLHF